MRTDQLNPATEAPDSRLRFSEAAELWLAGPGMDLRATTEAGYRSAVEQHTSGALEFAGSKASAPTSWRRSSGK
jgi:hypothetical protein